MRVTRAEALPGLLLVMSFVSVQAELEVDPSISTGLAGNSDTVGGYFSPSLSLEYRHPAVVLESDVSANWTADSDQPFALESWQSENRLVFFSDSPFYRLDLYQIHSQTEDVLTDTEQVRDSIGAGMTLERPLAATVRQGVSLGWDATEVSVAGQQDGSIQRLDAAYQLTWRVSPRQRQSLVVSGRFTDVDQRTLRLGWQAGYRLAETDFSAGLDYSVTQASEGDNEGIEGQLGLNRFIWFGDLNLQWRRSFVDSVTALTFDGIATNVNQSALVEVNQVSVGVSEIRTGDRSNASLSFQETHTRSRVSVQEISEQDLGRTRQIILGWALQGRSDSAYSVEYRFQQNETEYSHDARFGYQTQLNARFSFEASTSYRWQQPENTYEWRLGIGYQPNE